MAKHKEIEVKYKVDKLNKSLFNNKFKLWVKDLNYDTKYKYSEGPDTYYKLKDSVIRHRYSDDCHELTAKKRISNNSIKVRHEINLKLSDDTSPEDVKGLFNLSSFIPNLSVYKKCDMYTVNRKNIKTVICFYTVNINNKKKNNYLEIEVEGTNKKRSLKELNWWSKKVEELFSLSKKDISNKSLYEIYT